MLKTLKSSNYNYLFNLVTGSFARWGKNQEDDPEYCPFGSEIMDIEVSTKCSKGCSFCYKSNTVNGKSMTFDTFKNMFDKFPKMLTQIAFGIGDIDSNPDLWKIMKYCRNNKVIPNITINGERMTSEYYDKLVELCGAVAISHYNNETCYNAVQELNKRGMKQVNIHKLLSCETRQSCFKLMKDTKTDERLKGLNAIVFLWLKPKGNRNHLHQIKSLDQYKEIVDYAFDNDVRIGFDSCSASSFTKIIKDRSNFKELNQMVESCESTLFSYYINVDGIGFPCSFAEGEGFKGIDLKSIKNFKEVWYHPETFNFRLKLINGKDCNNCRQCPIFNLEIK